MINKKIKGFNYILIFPILLSFASNAQVKLRMDNKFHIGYDTYTPILLGSYAASGVDNGRWGIEYWDAMGGLNFWIPWPNPMAQNNVLFLRDDGFVGIGNTTPQFQLDVTGSIGVNNVYVASDSRLKTNIQPILNNDINKLYSLQGKSYFKRLDKSATSLNNIQDSTKRKSIQAQNNRINSNNSDPEFGYLAQEIAIIYPELVSGDSNNGHLSVNYIGLIPIIIEALKQQKQTIEGLSQQLNNCCQTTSNSSGNGNGNGTLGKKENNINDFKFNNALLQQNTPNPFSESTNISYYIPVNCNKAKIHIYNMQGTEIKAFDIKQRGEGKITISGYELKAGMYLYTLILDGQEIDTKRMILTQ